MQLFYDINILLYQLFAMTPIPDMHEVSRALVGPQQPNQSPVNTDQSPDINLQLVESAEILRTIEAIRDKVNDVISLVGHQPYNDFLRAASIYEKYLDAESTPEEAIRDIQELVVIQIRNILALIISAENLQKEKRKADAAAKKAQRLEEINRVLEKENKSDPLTGLYNRKGLDKEGTKVFEHCKKNDIPLSCLYIYLDFFKTVNDDHGHPVGDAVLKTFAQYISAKFREFIRKNFRQYDLTFSDLLEEGNDVIARDGGEEFMVLMPFTDLQEAQKAAERFREFIQNARITFVKSNGETRIITLENLSCTIGVTQANFKKDFSIHDLKARADEALKRGKAHRNVVCVTTINEDDETSYTFPYLHSPRRRPPKKPADTTENRKRYGSGNANE